MTKLIFLVQAFVYYHHHYDNDGVRESRLSSPLGICFSLSFFPMNFILSNRQLHDNDNSIQVSNGDDD